MQPNDRATIASMGPAAREAMLLEVSKEMISFGINNLGGTPEAGLILVQQYWLSDDLTQEQFIQHIEFMIRAIAVAQVVHTQHIQAARAAG